MDAFVSGPWHHYIIVEKVDMKLFAVLSGPRRTVMSKESILPKWIYHLFRLSFFPIANFWWSRGTGFMVGWHVQQLVKIQMAFVLKEEGMAMCDSDMFFVRPLDVSALSVDGKFRFYRSPELYTETDIANPSYTLKTLAQLGLSKDSFPLRTYVDNFATWHSATVRKMCQHIETVSGLNWMVSLGRNIIISEYSVYGLFVELVQKENLYVGPTSSHLCRTMWGKKQAKANDLDTFIKDLPEGVVSVGIQSFIGIEIEVLRKKFNDTLRVARSDLKNSES